MHTLKTMPELMTVIINIQMMKEKINPMYNAREDFKTLELLSEDELWEEQEGLIPEYNKACNWVK